MYHVFLSLLKVSSYQRLREYGVQTFEYQKLYFEEQKYIYLLSFQKAPSLKMGIYAKYSTTPLQIYADDLIFLIENFII